MWPCSLAVCSCCMKLASLLTNDEATNRILTNTEHRCLANSRLSLCHFWLIKAFPNICSEIFKNGRQAVCTICLHFYNVTLMFSSRGVRFRFCWTEHVLSRITCGLGLPLYSEPSTVVSPIARLDWWTLCGYQRAAGDVRRELERAAWGGCSPL